MGDLLRLLKIAVNQLELLKTTITPGRSVHRGGPWGITWEVSRASPWGIPQGDIPRPVCLSVNTLRGLRNHVLSIICQ
jgi:hypothetical protein